MPREMGIVTGVKGGGIFERAGIPGARVSPAEVQLEDVFVSLVKREGGAVAG